MRIVLQPRLLPPFPVGPVLLTPPWRWWGHQLRTGGDGTTFHQSADPAGPSGITERYTISFDLLNDYDIINPPSMYLTTIGPEFEAYGDRLGRTFMTRGATTECEVVWHQRPSDQWQELPGNTCRAGDYEMQTMDRGVRRERLSMTCRYSSGMSALDWRSVDIGHTESYTPAPPAIFSFPGSASAPLAFGDPTRVPAAAMPGPRLEDQLEQIMNARNEYMAAHRRYPVAVIMNHQDWELMRRDILRQQEADWLRDGLLGLRDDRRRFDTLFGTEVRAERNMPRGRILIVGDQDLMQPMQMPRTPDRGYGILSPNEIRDIEGIWAGGRAPTPRRDVLPEEDLIDEIDRLVNEQVKVGPVDDYRVNRYPKCPHCSHDWHGVLCDTCDCLGELEEDV